VNRRILGAAKTRHPQFITATFRLAANRRASQFVSVDRADPAGLNTGLAADSQTRLTIPASEYVSSLTCPLHRSLQIIVLNRRKVDGPAR
jgi:hypothetical protein